MLGDDLWDKFAIRLSDRIGQLIESRLRSFIDKYCRSSVKVVYSEGEAAEFLDVSLEAIQAWRKRGLITYCNYPQCKKDALGSLYSYDLTDLMNFRARYKRHSIGRNVYEFIPNVSPFGAEIESAKAA